MWPPYNHRPDNFTEEYYNLSIRGHIENCHRFDYRAFLQQAFKSNNLRMVDQIARKWYLSDHYILDEAILAVNINIMEEYQNKLKLNELQLKNSRMDWSKLKDLISWAMKRKIQLSITDNDILCQILALDDPQIYHFLLLNNINFNLHPGTFLPYSIRFNLDGRDYIRLQPTFLSVAVLYRCFNLIPHILNTEEFQDEVEYEHWDREDAIKKVRKKFGEERRLASLCFISHHHNSVSDKKSFSLMIKTLTNIYNIFDRWPRLLLAPTKIVGFELSVSGRLVNKRIMYLLWLAKKLRLPRLLVYQKIYSLL